MLATLKMERRAKLAIPQLPSTYSADVAAITGAMLSDPALIPEQMAPVCTRAIRTEAGSSLSCQHPKQA